MRGCLYSPNYFVHLKTAHFSRAKECSQSILFSLNDNLFAVAENIFLRKKKQKNFLPYLRRLS